MSFIQVNNLKKHYDYYEKEVGLKSSLKNLFYRKKMIKEAVNDISFTIEEGEIVGFLGPNGAGKTTTLKMLSGILFPTEGSLSVGGYIPWERKKNFKMMFSIVMGNKGQLNWDLPANESLFLTKCIYEIEDDQYNRTVEELSELLDVKDLMKVQVRRLSLGERMKMELIAALLHNPKVIYLDEPTIGLDFMSQKKIREFFKFYNQQQKTTIILTSHYMADIEDLCSRSIIINNGKIAFDGELKSLSEQISTGKYVKLQMDKEIDESELRSYGNVVSFDGYNATIEVQKQLVNECIISILNNFPVVDFTIEDISIEEGISYFYRKGEVIHETD